MNDIRYEPVFGDQELFNGADPAVVFVVKFVDGSKFYITEKERHESGVGFAPSGRGWFDVALRRIIRTPTWTKADYDAGRLPEVGAKHGFVGLPGIFTCLFIDCAGFVWSSGENNEVYCSEDNALCPIETDAERQQREREEWCSKALDSAGILSEMKCYELKRLGEYIGSIHDALLSGELKMPEVQK